MACGSESTLDYSVDYPCENPPGAGLEEEIYIFFKKDLTAGITRKAATGAGSKVLTGLPLSADAKLIKLTGFNLSNNYTNGFTQSVAGNKIPHNFQFAIFDLSEFGLHAADLLANSRIGVVSRDQDLEGEFRVHGMRTGMICTNLTSDKANENGGAIVLDFQAGNEKKTPDILRVVESNINKTREYLEALLTDKEPV